TSRSGSPVKESPSRRKRKRRSGGRFSSSTNTKVLRTTPRPVSGTMASWTLSKRDKRSPLDCRRRSTLQFPRRSSGSSVCRNHANHKGHKEHKGNKGYEGHKGCLTDIFR